jgi:hypothetical protein
MNNVVVKANKRVCIMKARIAKKIIKIWCESTDKRFFEDDGGIKEDKVSFFAHLYRKAVIKDNKMNDPGSNVSVMYAIRRNHKSCGCCTRFKHEDAYGNGWCSKLNVAKECGDWCEGKFFIKKKTLRLI